MPYATASHVCVNCLAPWLILEAVEAAAGQRQLAPGTMLDDKYRIESLLAVGGMGAVYVGTHVAIRKKVAIKVLNPQLSTPGMVARFQREAITASQIGHEGIAQVTDMGTSHGGEAFLVMELLEGDARSVPSRGDHRVADRPRGHRAGHRPRQELEWRVVHRHGAARG